MKRIESERKLSKDLAEETIGDNNDKEEDTIILIPDDKVQGIRLSYWLSKPTFYLFGICYMCVRLNSNVFGTFLPFFLIYVLRLSQGQESNSMPLSVALVPLVIYFSSSLLSARISFLYSSIGRKKTLLLGTLLSIISLGLLFALNS